MTVGDRIRQVRIEKDITQQELADCAGVSKQAVYKYENNIVTNIPMDKLGGSGAVRTNLPSEQSSSFSASPDEGDDPKFFRHSKCTVRTLGSNVTIQMVGSVFVLYCEIPTRQ